MLRIFLALWLALTPAFAWAGSMTLLGAGKVSASAPVYTGPGDVVSGATAWYGLRAYNAATAGNRAINLCDDTGANCTDISTSATTGKLNNPGTLGVNNCATSGTCEVKIWYDQSGALACGGSACNVTSTLSPFLIFNCINSLPCVSFPGGNTPLFSAATLATASTATISAVTTRTSNFTTQQNVLAFGNTSIIQLNFRALANAVQMYQGTTGQFISNITDSNFHAYQAVFNGASSDLFCGGSAGTSCSTAGISNSISPGTTATGATSLICISGTNSAGACAIGNGLGAGEITEVGIWNGTVFNGTQQTNMNANQYSFWGPF